MRPAKMEVPRRAWSIATPTERATFRLATPGRPMNHPMAKRFGVLVATQGLSLAAVVFILVKRRLIGDNPSLSLRPSIVEMVRSMVNDYGMRYHENPPTPTYTHTPPTRQAALLYTSTSGQRRVRCHTLGLPVTGVLMNIFRSVGGLLLAAG